MKIIITVIACVFIGIMTALVISVSKIEETARKYYQLERRDNMEYQIMLDADSIIIWDNDRYVGALPYDGSKLDSLLQQDNE